MGLCASCLGLNRHPSHKQAETQGLLNSRTPSQYGTVNDDEASAGAHDEEEESRMERRALEDISTRAADDMIDVLHVGPDPAIPTSSLSRSQDDPSDHAKTDGEDDHAEDAEQAWLQDLPVNELDQDVAVKGSYAGNLVIDLAQLRSQGTSNPRRTL